MAAEDHDLVVLGERDVQDFNPEGILPLSDNELVQIHRWLAPTDYSSVSSEFNKHHSSHLSGTGTWVLDTDQYRQWYDSEQGGLLIKAVTGAGKSVIAATIISKLATEEKFPVLYFFFRHIISANRRPESLVRDYLAQVLQYSPQLQHDLLDLIKVDERSIESMSFDELWDLLVAALTRLPRVYCVVDALDEMDTGSAPFLDSLIALTQEQPTSIKVLMTSRPLPRIERHIQNTDIIELALQSRLIDPDISTYVRYRMDQQKTFADFYSQIHDAICGRANGHFLYARLMMDNILDIARKTTNNQTLLRALDELPVPMADMYTRLLVEHSQRSGIPQFLQVAILRWITRAERPLRLLELSFMVDTKEIVPLVSKDAKSVIRKACGPLLEIFADETVHPIHHSFTEYLYDKNRLNQGPEVMRFPVLDYKQVQRALTTMCLQHLTSGWHTEWLMFTSGLANQVIDKVQYPSGSDRIAAKNTLKLKHPYLDYAAKHWYLHLYKSGPIDDSIVTALDQFFSDDSEILRACLTWAAERESLSQSPLKNEDFSKSSWSPLHVAACNGMTFLVKWLLWKGHDIEQTTSLKHTPLSLAALHGHHQVVDILLKNGAKNDEPDSSGLKPLHHAISSNHLEVTKLLLESGVDPFTPQHNELVRVTSTENPPVRYACFCGNLEMMEVIIPFLEGEQLQKALYWAVEFEETEVASAILQRPNVDVNYYVDGQTLLNIASGRRKLDIMRLLLDKGADANLLSKERPVVIHITHGGVRSRCHNYKGDLSPLHAFIRADNKHNARWKRNKNKSRKMLAGFLMLLEAGIDPNIADRSGFTVLHDMVGLYRTAYNYVLQGPINKDYVAPALALCFERGLCPTSVTKDGSSALHLASGVSSDVLNMLIDYGVDINTVRSSDGMTPLVAAMSMRNVAVAQHLLNRGVNVDIADLHGNTAIHFVGKLYQSMVDSDDPPNTPDPDDYSPRQDMIDLDLLPALLRAGADINLRNYHGETALHMHLFELDTVRLFIRNGFDIESKNGSGQTVLFQAVSRRSEEEYYKELVKLGADPLTRDGRGQTVLHALIGGSHWSRWSESSLTGIIQYFVEKGVDPRSTDTQGDNLWHKMANNKTNHHSSEQLAVMHLLVQYKVPLMARNTAGQTPIHVAFSWNYTGSHLNEVLKFLFEHDLVDINVATNDQVQPLHLTASHDLRTTCFLLECGADCVAATKEGQTALMIACRTRQCDIVCFLLDYYKTKDLLHLIDQKDEIGRTALHYACRSGRPETVAMLLEAGASVNSRDKNDIMPIHACAEYREEDLSWQRLIGPNLTQASYVLLTDSSKILYGQNELDPIRIRETVRLLIKYGADTSFLAKEYYVDRDETSNNVGTSRDTPVSPLVTAIKSGCAAIVSELLLVGTKVCQEKRSHISIAGGEISHSGNAELDAFEAQRAYTSQLSSLNARIDLLKMQYMQDSIKSSSRSDESSFRLVEKILRDDEEPSVKQIAKLGARFSKFDGSHMSVAHLLATWGFADLLCELNEDDVDMDLAWTRETSFKSNRYSNGHVCSVLFCALTRRVPNMAVVKAVVSSSQLDINEMFIDTFQQNTRTTYVHILATSSYWWQTKALAYLLENGANIDPLDSEGNTPLILALKASIIGSSDPVRIKTIQILLSYGANPNARDASSLACLDIAARNSDYVELLLNSGADPSDSVQSSLFDAIEAQDINAIKHVVASGADPNRVCRIATKLKGNLIVVHEPHTTFTTDYPSDAVQRFFKPTGPESSFAYAYPIHVAASGLFDTPEKVTHARMIIKLLLDTGADPFRKYEDGSSILHYLVSSGGLIEPLLALPECDVEVRDARGCTLLLTTCAFRQVNSDNDRQSFRSREIVQALRKHGCSITAVDNEGRNALHHLIDTFDKCGHDWKHEHALLQHFLPSCLHQTDLEGRSPFHHAVSKCHIDAIQLLMTHGADPRVPDPVDNTTALHHLAPLLVNDEDVRLVQQLHSCIDPKGSHTTKKRKIDSAESLRDVTDFIDQYHQEYLAMIDKRPSHVVFGSLLERGVLINGQETSGETPIFKLAGEGGRRGNHFDEGGIHISLLLSAFQFLEGAGADLQARNHAGESILHKLAKHETSLDLEFYEIDKLNATQMDMRGQDMDLRESFEWLVSKGLDVAWEDNEQRTCLDVATAFGATWLTKLYERE